MHCGALSPLIHPRVGVSPLLPYQTPPLDRCFLALAAHAGRCSVPASSLTVGQDSSLLLGLCIFPPYKRNSGYNPSLCLGTAEKGTSKGNTVLTRILRDRPGTAVPRPGR